MNKLTEIFLSRIVAPILLLLVTPVVISFISFVKTGDTWKYFDQIPNWIKILFTVACLFWIVLITINKRNKEINSRNRKYHSPVFFMPVGGYVDIGKYRYDKVDWIIRHPRLDTYEEVTEENMWRFIDPKSIHIGSDIRCIECGTELIEKHNFWGGITFYCPRRDFEKKSKKSISEMSEIVEKLVRRDIEQKKYGK